MIDFKADPKVFELNKLCKQYVASCEKFESMLDWMEVVEEAEYVANENHVKECLGNLNDSQHNLEQFFQGAK